MVQIKLSCLKTENGAINWRTGDGYGLLVCPYPGRIGQRDTFLRNCGVLAPPHAEGRLLLNRLRGEAYCITFGQELLPQEPAQGTITAPVLLADMDDGFIDYFLAAFRLLESGGRPELARQTVECLLQWLSGQPLFTAGRQTSHARQLVEQARQIIQAEFASDLTLQQLAERLFINPCYLSTVFHEQTGQTFREYLKTVRLQHARRHLLESNRQITDIAMLSGFNSTAYLIRSFREKYGITPSVFRAQQSIDPGGRQDDT